MREILFRGKIPCGIWRESRCPDGVMHSGVLDYPFDPETVGQYTGLKDKNGKKIFEGDVCRYEDEALCLIRWCKVDALFDVLFDFQSETATSETLRDIWEKDLEIIGNIFDNPELMEVQE